MHTCLEAEMSRSHSDWGAVWKMNDGSPIVGHCQPTAILPRRVLQSDMHSCSVGKSFCLPVQLPGPTTRSCPLSKAWPTPDRLIISCRAFTSRRVPWQPHACLWPAQMGGTSPPSPAAGVCFGFVSVGTVSVELTDVVRLERSGGAGAASKGGE